MILIIVESPSKIKKIKQYAEKILNDTVVCMASLGHIGNFSRAINSDDVQSFNFPYEVDSYKKQNLKKIIEFAQKAKIIYLASDPDREGEGIAHRLQEQILKHKIKTKIKRVTFNEITEKGVKEGFKNIRDINTNLVNAQISRAALDQLIGYGLTGKLRYGNVQKL